MRADQCYQYHQNNSNGSLRHTTRPRTLMTWILYDYWMSSCGIRCSERRCAPPMRESRSCTQEYPWSADTVRDRPTVTPLPRQVHASSSDVHPSLNSYHLRPSAGPSLEKHGRVSRQRVGAYMVTTENDEDRCTGRMVSGLVVWSMTIVAYRSRATLF